MYLNIIIFPLFGSIIAGFFGRFLSGKGAGIITIFSVTLSCILSSLAFYEVGLACCPTYIKIATWLDSDLLQINWGFCFDSLTVTMLFVVTFISMLVHIYSLEYMKLDPHLSRFMSYLSLFTFFMLILVTSDNFVQMFLGWEGVGLCSYLLINFWFTRIQANKAAIKAMLINRIGDFSLALSIFGIFFYFKSVDYAIVFALAPQYSYYTCYSFFNIKFYVLDLLCLLLFIGAMGKSAQLGLHTWLPDAMEGPTPVSALIHAATMVTAGVFLLVRCSPMLEYSLNILFIISIIGAMTAFFAATTALVQNDLKRIIAYSTCSQLGYMIFACGLSNYSIAIFHLSNHAFFKALLFLGSGSVIHALGDEQDIRKMGGLRKILPFTYSIMVIGSFALMGIPFLTGFYSKDLILEASYSVYSYSSHFAYWLGSLSAFCTAFYSIRLLTLCFLSEPNGSRFLILSASESNWLIGFVLAALALPSIFIGYLTKDLFVGLGTNFWGNSIFILPQQLTVLDAEFIPLFFKLIPLFLSISGSLLSFFVYFNSNWNKLLFYLKISMLGRKIYQFLNKKWLFDKIYNEVITQNVLSLSYYFTYKWIDRGLIESLGPFGLSTTILFQVRKNQLWQSGYIYHYSLIFVLGIFIFSLIYLFHLFSFKIFSLLCLSAILINSL
uniref:NADH dehydrogenase subunit 5 n=1 Tax=Dictyotopsis propagulifera TaxID=670095 RepID=UPI002E795BEF|nr:NADH dehydrogenase subunit 5 [Dictyotopsis propagulifera]WBP69967.1 NADH dehydrogenase subunit 5 [Dictyotopsis propagulifera]